jgi:hypothetical protein
MLQYVLYVLAVAGVFRAKQNGFAIQDFPSLLRAYLKRVVLLGAKTLQGIAGKV